MNSKRLLFIATFLSTILFACKCASKQPVIEPPSIVEIKDTTPKKPIIIIDAGHGGNDPGAVNDSAKLYEKTFTRNIVDALIKEIDTSYIIPIQTRLGDSNINRHIRIERASKCNPNMLLTIHINYDKDTTYNGFEISFNDTIIDKIVNGIDTIKQLNPFKAINLKYGKILNKKIAAKFPKMRQRGISIRKDDIWMLYAGKYPSLLLEFGFISNRKDLTTLKDKKEIKKLALALQSSIYEIFSIKAS